MNSALTISEMQRQFADEWILVEDPQSDAALKVQSGRVLFHSRDRDEVYRQAIALHPPRFAILFTGKPQTTEIVLSTLAA